MQESWFSLRFHFPFADSDHRPCNSSNLIKITVGGVVPIILKLSTSGLAKAEPELL